MNITELFKLAGIVIVVVGLALRLRTTLVVVVAGLATGLLAGLPLLTGAGVFEGVPVLTKPGQEGIVNILGRAFAENRLMTLFIVTLPAIGLAERYGLQEQSARFIRRVSAATVGRLLITYQLFRVLMGILGMRLLGHQAFARPLVFPMALGAAEAEAGAQSVEAVGAEVAQPLASLFKIYVLGTLVARIASGQAQWTDTFPIHEDWKSLPSGDLQNLADGTPVSLRTYAEKMISISDNTAADHLIHFLGRGAVQAQTRRFGIADPEANEPFLTTR